MMFEAILLARGSPVSLLGYFERKDRSAGRGEGVGRSRLHAV